MAETPMQDMKDRIRQIMESQHMTQQVFATFIGTTAGTLSGIFNERTKPTLNIVELIKKKIPDINTDWLMFGTGSMYLSSSPHPGAGTDQAQGGSQGLPAANLSATSSGVPTEPLIDFGAPFASGQQFGGQTATAGKGVQNTPQTIVREEIKYIDKPARRVTEIRVYYDDQTWESFVPSKK